MRSSIAISAALVLGAFTWTLVEYLLHRFVFHGASAKSIGAREHRRHHAEVDYFAPWWQKALAAVAAMALLLPLSVVSSSWIAGLSFTTGFIVMYLSYEVLHRRAHTHPPRGFYGRWLRQNHFAHHFVDPHRAHGVTSPIWDIVFGTRLPLTRSRVPRRLAMPWLIDPDGEIWPDFAQDFELVGKGGRDALTRRADMLAANENRCPE